ncbi:MAG: phosphotransferase family protein [Gammaproteobacteria bacterium]|jgi:hypothetical protein|nr:phosphotransferase [Gammaproteobacteria bacterium]
MATDVTSPASSVSVTDPYGICDDQALGHAREALDPDAINHAFAVAKFASEDLSSKRLQEVRVTRHKPGKRCVIEYDLEAASNAQRTTLVGKIRRKRSGRSAFELSRNFSSKGFDAAADDGISVPEAIAYVKKLGLWLQRKVPGVEASSLLESPAGPDLGSRIAEAAYKIHCAGVPAARVHDVDDELEILDKCLFAVIRGNPLWQRRLLRLMMCARLLAETLRGRALCGIHRDFYADQVIVDRDRLWLLDFDLYCQGDPALDIGNFIGHVSEQSLRNTGLPCSLSEVEKAIEKRYVELAGEEARPAIRAYSLLTLMRHIYISTLHPSRRHTTADLILLCEVRAVDLLCRPT